LSHLKPFFSKFIFFLPVQEIIAFNHYHFSATFFLPPENSKERTAPYSGVVGGVGALVPLRRIAANKNKAFS